MKLKKLKWSGTNDYIEAETPFGVYAILITEKGWRHPGAIRIKSHLGIEDAKKKAQEHCEKSIMKMVIIDGEEG